jgi:cell division protein FtsL
MPVHKEAPNFKVQYLVPIVLFLILLSTVRSTIDIKQSLRRLEEIKEKLKLEEIQNQKLKNELNYVNSDNYVEKVAIEELNMTKPGYKILVINEVTPDDIQKQIIKEPAQRQKSNLELWLEAFNLN